MAKKEELVIRIGKDGNVNMEYKGATGKKCVDATEEIEVALGKVAKREKTADYYKPDPKKDVYETR